jgi:hypothetical protein
MLKHEILALPPDARANLLAFMKARGSPEARAEALEMEAALARSAPPPDDRIDRVAKQWLAEDERYMEKLQREMVQAAPESALRFAKQGGEPTLPPWAYDEALLEYAKSQARPEGSEARALARLIRDRDETVHALYAASRQATARLEKAAADDRHASAGDRLAKRQDIEDRMEKYAAASARPGESEAQAYDRLLREDPTMRDLYAQHRATSA